MRAALPLRQTTATTRTARSGRRPALGPFSADGLALYYSRMPATSRLEAHFATYPSVLVAYSGGVDSALVAVAARRALGRDRSVAALGVSPSLAATQHEQARCVAQRFDLQLIEVETAEFSVPGYVANPVDRCYHCKVELWSTLAAEATRLGLAAVVDGTNADDGSEHRPGIRAAQEAGVRSPLLELGYTKAAVRAEAKARGLPIWDAPAAPCLSSRIMYGLQVTPKRVRQVEQGEVVLRAAGVEGDLRVRHRGREARIEVALSQLERVRARHGAIAAQLLALGFDRVTLDLDGYRRGSQLEGAEPSLEILAERD